jgi:pyruvate/2-oxoglutarate dehydrogenase complex dihydrolipoamide dehydrogenase (E3) component
VAAAAAALAVPTVLVERDRMGGECLSAGCVPASALIAAAKVAATMRGAARFGIHGSEPRADMARVRARSREIVARIAPGATAARYRAMGVTVVEAAAHFSDARTLTAGGVTIRARRFVIATGSKPVIPALEGIDLVRFHTSETVFDLDRLPSRLIVLGGGSTGLELAQAFRRLGSECVVLDAGQALAGEDPECVAVLIAALAREGVVVRQNVKLARLEPRGTGVRAMLTGATIEEPVVGSDILVATGRRYNVAALAIEAAGIRHEAGRILVDGTMRTSNRAIYAIGDAVGAGSAHAACAQAAVVVRHALFRLPARFDPARVPRVTFCDPELATVGLSEDEARERHRKIDILRWPLSENDRARALGATAGLVKVVTDRRGRILGASILASGAGELVTPWTLALSKRLKARDIAGLAIPYPTLSEASGRAALGAITAKLGDPWLSRLLRLLRRMG